jgi:hypothetical protein
VENLEDLEGRKFVQARFDEAGKFSAEEKAPCASRMGRKDVNKYSPRLLEVKP